MGHIGPFQIVTYVITFVVNNRGNVQIKQASADLYLGAMGQIAGVCQDSSLVFRILVEDVNTCSN